MKLVFTLCKPKLDDYASHEKQKLDDLKIREKEIIHEIDASREQNNKLDQLMSRIKQAITTTNRRLNGMDEVCGSKV